MTKQRPNNWICESKNCPHESAKHFNDWVRENLPDSYDGFLASDLDLILYNYKTKKVMLLEVKTRKAKLKEWQKQMFENIDRWLKKGCDNFEYLGFNIIRLEGTDLTNGRILFNNKLVTEAEVKEKLSF